MELKVNRSLILTCVCAAVSATSLYAKKVQKPNVLIIYTDDHRYTGVHCLGGQAVRTPNIDALANNGIAFTNAYLQGGFTGATSVPSRAMLLTGRNLFHLDGMGFDVPKKDITIGEVFGNAGYCTHHIGKWHQDLFTLARSFQNGDHIAGKPVYLCDQFRASLSDWDATGKYDKKKCYYLHYNEQGEIMKLPSLGAKKGPVGTEKDGPHVASVLGDDAVRFFKNYKDKRPFFVYLAFPCPHDPRQSPQKYKNMYPEDNIQLPPSYMLQHPFDNGHCFLRDEELAPWPRTPQVARKHLSDYYASITYTDEQIGRVIRELKASGQYENTLIIFAGDSGLAVGNHGLMGKQSVYDEDGIHVPFIISGGLVKNEDKGRREPAFCYIHDIMPTICQWVNLPIPSSVNGTSLMPVIKHETKQIHDELYFAYRQHQRAIRKGDYKLIEYVKAPDFEKSRGEFMSGSRVTQLFNIAKDPWETQNLAFFPEYAGLIASLQKDMKAMAQKFEDKADGKRTKVNFWQYYN